MLYHLSRLAICKPQVDYASDTVVDSSTFQPLNVSSHGHQWIALMLSGITQRSMDNRQR